MSRAKPIVIDALWRTCSTYFWAKFRDAEDQDGSSIRAYYEVLHQTLAENTQGQYDAMHQNVIPSMHGKVLKDPAAAEKHFWSEFPLREGGGVAEYDARFALDDYVLSPRDEDENQDLEKYLNSLIKHANDQGQRTFMEFNRAALRAEWIKSKLDSVSIHLTRHPGQLLASYMQFSQRDYNFINHMANIIHKNADHPIFAEFAEYSGLDENQKVFLKYIDTETGEFKGNGKQFWQDMVGFFWAIDLAAASRHADLLIDVNAIGRELERGVLAEEIADLTGVAVDLSDFDLERNNFNYAMSDYTKQITANAIKRIEPDYRYLHEGVTLSGCSRQLLQSILWVAPNLDMSNDPQITLT